MSVKIQPVVLLVLLGILLSCQPIPAAEVVDQVLATVDRAPILESDLILAGLVGLGEPAPVSPPLTREQRSRLLTHRIELQLEFEDLRSSGSLPGLEIDVEDEVNRICAAAGGEETLNHRLEKHHLSRQDVEALAFRIAATRAWVETRLRARVRVRPEDLEEAYRRELVIPLQARGQKAPPAATVEAELRRLVEEEKLNVLIQRWLDEARKSHEVLRFAP